MILKRAIRAFLEGPSDSHDWIKKLKRKELLRAVMELRPRPRFDDTLFAHQLACFLLGVAYPEFGFWLDMGTGKTRLTLELLRYHARANGMRRAIVFITSDKAYPTWAKQIEEYNIGLPYIHLEGSGKQKWAALDEIEDGLIFVSYPGATDMCSTTVRVKGKNKWKLKRALVSRLGHGVDAVVLDESTKAAGQSLTNRLAGRLMRRARFRYALAGRPFGRDPTLLWAQQKLLDGGKTLGPTKELFRAAFFSAKKSFWSCNPRSMKYTFKKEMRPTLSRMMQHRSITYAVDECLDLPKINRIIEEVRFPADLQEYYDAAIAAIIRAKGDYREMSNVFMRLRQLSSGFVGMKNDETGERAEVEFDHNPKFDRTMELLDNLPADRKAVLFYEFTYSGRKIAAAAKELGLRPIWLWSGTKDYKRDLHNFEKKDRYRLAVVNNKVGAYSLDGLQVANYAIFYESPLSAIDREQAERRLRRQGQKRRIFQYDMVVRGSVDSKILSYHKEAEDLMNAVLRNPALLKVKRK